MKKLMLSMLAIAFAATSVMANGHVSAKKAKIVKQTTCTSCNKGQKCAETICTTPDCCK